MSRDMREGNDVGIAKLGPDTVVGTETLMEGVSSGVTIVTSEDSLVTVLTREAFQEYLEARDLIG